jgi:hypothetical protein
MTASATKLQQIQAQILNLTSINDEYRKKMDALVEKMGDVNDELTRLMIQKRRMMATRGYEG